MDIHELEEVLFNEFNVEKNKSLFDDKKLVYKSINYLREYNLNLLYDFIVLIPNNLWDDVDIAISCIIGIHEIEKEYKRDLIKSIIPASLWNNRYNTIRALELIYNIYHDDINRIVPSYLLDDRDIGYRLVSDDFYNLRLLSKNLKSNPTIALAAVENYADYIYDDSYCYDPIYLNAKCYFEILLDMLDSSLKSNEEFINEMIEEYIKHDSRLHDVFKDWVDKKFYDSVSELVVKWRE